MSENGKIREECGVFGVSLRVPEAAGVVYNGLLAMQHRGQEGAGIAVSVGPRILYHKDRGLVSEVFSQDVMARMPASDLAIGHVRYSTTGEDTVDNVQPFISDWMTGRIATAHNGNITNCAELRGDLQRHGVNFDATSDSEIISDLIAYKSLQSGGDIFEAAKEACRELVGAYSLLVMTGRRRILALRDPHGYRPLCLGRNEYGVCAASESCALDSCGFEFLRDIEPGEAVILQDGKITHSEIFDRSSRMGSCIFEYVYFARPDSVLDGQSVYEARLNMGRILAREHPAEADVVCGAPDSGLDAAAGYSLESGIPLVTGFVKNRYIGRSFIFPSQTQRENAVKMKLNPLRPSVEGKRVVLVDDSIVRGTTSDQIIANLRHAGAMEVHVRISSPPFLHSCYYGTDIAEESQLIANRYSLEEIRQRIGADSLGYISIGGLKSACSSCRQPFCTGCFNGEYWQEKDAP